MKSHRIVTRLLSGLAVASLLSIASLTAASAANPATVIIVNSEQVFAQSKVGVNVRTQIQDGATKLKAEGAKVENSLRDEAKKLGGQRGLLKEEDFAKKVQAFQAKEEAAQRSLQEKGQALQLGANAARAQIEAAIRPIFADVLKAHNANILLDQSVVLAGGVDLDVTAEVIKALDAKLTSVKVTPQSPKK